MVITDTVSGSTPVHTCQSMPKSQSNEIYEYIRCRVVPSFLERVTLCQTLGRGTEPETFILYYKL